jgi:type VI secretion system secreted protein Hcp
MRVKLLAAAVLTAGIAASWVLVPGKAPGGLTDIPPAYSAQADYFLKLDGIEGESQDKGHKGEIEIDSFSWGLSQGGSGIRGAIGAGGGGGAGKASFQDMSFTTSVSKASPKLMLAAATGEHIKQAVLVARKAGGDQQEYYRVQLSDVLVSSFQNDGGAAGVGESFSLNFAKIEFEYRPQKADGSLDAPVKAGYDVKANKKI